jgi:hypothetical protein
MAPMAPEKKAGYGALPDVEQEATKERVNLPFARPPSGLMKTHGSFHEDLKNFAEGTVPQSIIVALVIGKLKMSRPRKYRTLWFVKFPNFHLLS